MPYVNIVTRLSNGNMFHLPWIISFLWLRVAQIVSIILLWHAFIAIVANQPKLKRWIP